MVLVIAALFLVPHGAFASTQVGKDTFHRPNQQRWGTASDGQKWGGDALASEVFIIHNNTGVINAARGVGGSYNALLGGSFKNGKVVVTSSLSDYRGGNIGAILRWKDRNNWYKAFINGSKLVLEKRVNGQFVRIKETSFTAFPRTLYTIEFTADGSTLTARVLAGSAVLAVVKGNDTSHTSGVAGIRVDLDGITQARFTSFLATSL